MKSFFSFFALFVALVTSVFVLAYNSDTILQKTSDLSIQEGSGVAVSDHREAYPGVVYTWYIDGKQVEGITTPGLLLDRNQFSDVIGENGNNTTTRKIERIMKDDYQSSKEYLANIAVLNTAPQIADAHIEKATIDSIQYKFSAFDPASSDYPLVSRIELQNEAGEMLAFQEQSIQNSNPFVGNFVTNFARCNKTLRLEFKVSDDLDTISYSLPVFVDCPVSATINVETDVLSQYLYSFSVSDTMYSLQKDIDQNNSLSFVSLLKDSYNILFSKGFLQAIAVRKIVL